MSEIALTVIKVLFLALLWVATARLSLIGVGATMFFGGAFYLSQNVPHVEERVDVWLDPFAKGVVDNEGYQLAQPLFAPAGEGGERLLAHETNAPIENGVLWPSRVTLYAAMAMQSEFNGRMLEIIRELAGSAFITLPSSPWPTPPGGSPPKVC